jgi:hypothetical protein
MIKKLLVATLFIFAVHASADNGKTQSKRSLATSSATTVFINSYQCGSYTALVTGSQASSGLGDNPYDTVIFVSANNKTYTLDQLSPSVANIAGADFLWQCSGPSASQGCAISAKMIVNGSSTPNSLTLQANNQSPITCQETKDSSVPTAINTTNK